MTDSEEVTTKSSQLERRRQRNWFARFSITVIVVATFLILVALLFFSDVPADARDLLNILLGAYVAVLAKSTDYWFKEKEDPEIAEGRAINEADNGNAIG